jgi:hypothetical protein
MALVRTSQMNFQRVRRRLAQLIRGGACLEELTGEQRRDMWPPALTLELKHLRNCRLLPDRTQMLGHMPAGATCGEIGILHCDFSEQIWRITKPRKLYLFDIAERAIAIARDKFAAEIAQGGIELRQGDSAIELERFPDRYFDWLYIDGDHTYEAVKRDLDASCRKIRPGGLIAFNDYVYFGASDFTKYGVVEAVHEFCVEYDFEFVFFALQGRMYNDVVLRQIKPADN